MAETTSPKPMCNLLCDLPMSDEILGGKFPAVCVPFSEQAFVSDVNICSYC